MLCIFGTPKIYDFLAHCWNSVDMSERERTLACHCSKTTSLWAK